MNEVLTLAVGLCILLLFLYSIGKFNSNYSKKLLDTLSEDALKISNKKCSLKRIKKVDFIDKRFFFKICNLFVGSDFVVVQGIRDYIFKQPILNIMFCKNQEQLRAKYPRFDIIKPISIEFSKNKNEVKIVFHPTRALSSTDYSLIISQLSEKEFEKLEKIKNWI